MPHRESVGRSKGVKNATFVSICLVVKISNRNDKLSMKLKTVKTLYVEQVPTITIVD